MNSATTIAIQPELASGETVQWSGQPNTRIIFHKDDVYLIPFSLLWGGFAIFWEAGVSGLWGLGSHGDNRWIFGMIWGIPFVVAGQYLIWGRFFYSAWKKKRTYYAVTNRRVIVVQNGWKRNMASAYLDTLPTILKEDARDGIGTLRFAPAEPVFARQGLNRFGAGPWDSVSVGAIPTFVDIDDVESVYRLVTDLREKSRLNRNAQ